MIKYILGCLSFSVGFIGMFSIFAVIQSFKQRKQIEWLKKENLKLKARLSFLNSKVSHHIKDEDEGNEE